MIILIRSSSYLAPTDCVALSRLHNRIPPAVVVYGNKKKVSYIICDLPYAAKYSLKRFTTKLMNNRSYLLNCASNHCAINLNTSNRPKLRYRFYGAPSRKVLAAFA